MRVNANAVLRSWTLLAAFGGSYAPVIVYTNYSPLSQCNTKYCGVHIHASVSPHSAQKESGAALSKNSMFTAGA